MKYPHMSVIVTAYKVFFTEVFTATPGATLITKALI